MRRVCGGGVVGRSTARDRARSATDGDGARASATPFAHARLSEIEVGTGAEMCDWECDDGDRRGRRAASNDGERANGESREREDPKTTRAR